MRHINPRRRMLMLKMLKNAKKIKFQNTEKTSKAFCYLLHTSLMISLPFLAATMETASDFMS